MDELDHLTFLFFIFITINQMMNMYMRKDYYYCKI